MQSLPPGALRGQGIRRTGGTRPQNLASRQNLRALLASQAFLFGDRPTLADAALYGNFAMLDEADRGLLPRLDARFVRFARDVEARFVPAPA